MTSISKCSIIKLNHIDNIPAASFGPQYLVSDYFPVVCWKIQDLILSWSQANRFPFRKRSFQFVRLKWPSKCCMKSKLRENVYYKAVLWILVLYSCCTPKQLIAIKSDFFG
ncbi:hypothetical protein ABKV19_026809 [Rosa sericea]